MPRLAVRLLLALVLCLNGFLAPVAMAAHADSTTVAAQKAPPCHGDDAAGTTATDHADRDGVPSCCTPGHCVCACVFSVSLPFGAGTGFVAGRSQTVPLPRAVALPPARDSVPLRPPIG